MKHPLVAYFGRYLALTPAEEAFLTQEVLIVERPKKHLLLTVGQVSTAFYFIISGGVRMYYLVDGVEKTTFFYQANEFVSSYESFTQGIPATHYLTTVKPTQLAVFDQTTVGKALAQHPRFECLARVVMEQELSTYQRMLAAFVTLNAEQRYVQLLAQQPSLLQELPQHQIATYLGVSPETLSRIKNRVHQKRNS